MAEQYGLIFDVDGVIADSEAVNAEVSIRVFEDLFGVKGVRRDDFNKGLGRGSAEYVLAAAQVHDLELDEQQIAGATAARQDYFITRLNERPLPPFPGVMVLFQTALVHPDFAPAIATSSTREKSVAVLKSAGIPYENVVYITGSDVTHKKPHPELFNRAVEQLKIPSACCVVIEDAPNGIEAAKAAGCRCIAVTNSVAAGKLDQADRVVDSLEEIDLDQIRFLLQS
jgi:beta-phosphoglucomutase-like phosphatase (HAD superfamily)